MVTIKQINIALNEAGMKGVKLAKGNCYFYIYSDDIKTGEKICSLPQTAIYVYRLNNLTLNQWVEAARELISK